MKKIMFLLFIVSISSIIGQEKFKANFDYTVFQQEEQTAILEIYYSYDKSSMKLLLDADKKYVGGVLNIKIVQKEKDTLLLDKKWKFNSEIEEDDKNHFLTGLLRFNLPSGNYSCKITGNDITNETATEIKEFDLTILPKKKDVISVSGIEIAQSIIQQSKDIESIFYKNTLEVIPNPNLVFGQELPVIYFYSEIYNLFSSTTDSKIKIEHKIVNDKNKLVYSKEKFRSKKQNNIVEIGAIPINKFPTGGYTLSIIVTDSIKSISKYSSKKFYVINPNVIDDDNLNTAISEYTASEFMVMTVEEIDDNFNSAKYIANEIEIKQWKKLSQLDSKRKFLFEFWNGRDENPLTEVNEYKEDYFIRKNYANKQFKSLSYKHGWQSDMGRVFMIYGRPSEIERFPNDKDTRPYQIWHYDAIESGVKFVFADFTGFGSFRLIHSNKRGELSNSTWANTIIIN